MTTRPIARDAALLPDRLDRAQYARVAWLPDSSGCFVSRLRRGAVRGETDYFDHSVVWLHALHGDPQNDLRSAGGGDVVDGYRIAASEFPAVLTDPSWKWAVLQSSGAVRRYNPRLHAVVRGWKVSVVVWNARAAGLVEIGHVQANPVRYWHSQPRASLMKTPPQLQELLDDGIIDEVIRQLKSGKEAAVFVVRCGAEIRCAKVYKDMAQRSFQKRAQYQEGRKVRGSRDARAMSKSTRFGREQQEAAWKTTEIDALYKLIAAGVHVPQPYGMFGGVLLMEMVVDANGESAPRLGEVDFTPEDARETHRFLIRQVVRMLCAGVIHGDLSEFNVLVGVNGPVIIDLPQAVNASANNSAFAMLERDVNNLALTLGRFAPELLTTLYAKEMWVLFEQGELTPETPLTGVFISDAPAPDVDEVLGAIDDAREEALHRQRGREEAAAEQEG